MEWPWSNPFSGSYSDLRRSSGKTEFKTLWRSRVGIRRGRVIFPRPAEFQIPSSTISLSGDVARTIVQRTHLHYCAV